MQCLSFFSSNYPQANFTVLYDNVLETRSANAGQLQFQQLLWGHSYSNACIGHTVTLILNKTSGTDWFELDFLIFSFSK